MPKSNGKVPNHPDPQSWRLIRLAELAGHSQIFLLYRHDKLDPFALEPDRHGFRRLTNLSLFDQNLKHPLLPQVASQWQRVALSCSPSRVKLEDKGVFLEEGPLWVLGFEWSPSSATSAWQAFFSAQQKLRPRAFSLAPHFLVPLMFLTRLAAYPLWPEPGQLSRGQWLPLLAGSHKELLGLVVGLYHYWLLGPSRAATRYQKQFALAEQSAVVDDEAASFVRPFLKWVGIGSLDELLQAERVEPVVLRLLEKASQQLWEEEGGKAAKKPRGLAVRGLLPLALWDEALRTRWGIDLAKIGSVEDLEAHWRGSK